MPTWTRALSNGAKMIIEDTGSIVRFLLKGPTAGIGSVWIYWSLHISYNDDTPNVLFPNESDQFVSGSGTQLLGSYTVSSTAYLEYSIKSTNPSATAFGSIWPVTLGATIMRGSTPDPPNVTILSKNFTSITAAVADADDNDNEISNRELRYGVSASGPFTTLSAPDPPAGITISNLAPSTQYFLQARTYNIRGWSDWGNLKSVYTSAGAFVKKDGVWKTAIPYVNVNGVWKAGYCQVRYLGTWKDTL